MPTWMSWPIFSSTDIFLRVLSAHDIAFFEGRKGDGADCAKAPSDAVSKQRIGRKLVSFICIARGDKGRDKGDGDGYAAADQGIPRPGDDRAEIGRAHV